MLMCMWVCVIVFSSNDTTKIKIPLSEKNINISEKNYIILYTLFAKNRKDKASDNWFTNLGIKVMPTKSWDHLFLALSKIHVILGL